MIPKTTANKPATKVRRKAIERRKAEREFQTTSQEKLAALKTFTEPTKSTTSVFEVEGNSISKSLNIGHSGHKEIRVHLKTDGTNQSVGLFQRDDETVAWRPYLTEDYSAPVQEIINANFTSLNNHLTMEQRVPSRRPTALHKPK
mgnify:CR=1 FL=1|jgi:hypothetical protein